MNLDRLGLFQLIARRLDWLSQRQTVLAQNVANADTPDYQARDLRPFADYVGGSFARKLEPAVTQPGHIAVGHGPGDARSEHQRDLYEVSPSGNEVNLEQQLMQLGDTAMAHQTAINLYRKQLGMIRLALGSGRG